MSVVLSWPDVLDALEARAIRFEIEAFWRQHDELLAAYPGQHVALRHGSVVDHDCNASLFDARVRDRFGLAPVLIAPVKPMLRGELHWRGGRVDRMGGASATIRGPTDPVVSSGSGKDIAE